jgi:hypothetical protein
MTRVVAARRRGTIVGRQAAIFEVDLALVGLCVLIPAVAALARVALGGAALARADRVVASVVTTAMSDPVAGDSAAAVEVSAGATAGTHARRHLHGNRRATAQWRKPGLPP